MYALIIVDMVNGDIAKLVNALRLIVQSVYQFKHDELSKCNQVSDADFEKMQKWASIFENFRTYGEIVTENLIEHHGEIESDRLDLVSQVLSNDFDRAGVNYAKIIELAVGAINPNQFII